MTRRIGVIAATLTLAFAGGAQAAASWRDFPGVENSGFVETGGDRVMQLSIVVPAPRAEVWRAFTTSDGYRTWATPLASVDLQVDGMIETNYDAAAKLGSADNIKNQITAYVPQRLLVMRNVQAPTGFPGAAEFAKTAVVIELAEVTPQSTRVTLSGVGYGPGPVFDNLYRQFEWANAYSLAELKSRFVNGPIDWAARAAKEKAAAADRKVQGGAKP